jgi:hypothetical protein
VERSLLAEAPTLEAAMGTKNRVGTEYGIEPNIALKTKVLKLE